MSKQNKKDQFFEKLNQDNMQFMFLQHMINDNRDNEELTNLVLDKMAENKFRLGMMAKDFYVACADQIFMRNQKDCPVIPGEDPRDRMKRLHPLWGKSYMSD